MSTQKGGAWTRRESVCVHGGAAAQQFIGLQELEKGILYLA